jgi:hypothetical protein
MKTLFFVLLSTAMAEASSIAACSTQDLVDLENSIVEWSQEGLPHVSYIKNSKNEILGFFASDNDTEIYAEICESIYSNDLTVSNRWYYWDSEQFKSNPSTWMVGANYPLSQDEGLANMKLLEASLTGDVTVEFSIQGWNSESERVTVKEEIVKLIPKN